MKAHHQAVKENEKGQHRTIVIIGVIILVLQLTFHLTVDAKSINVDDSIQVEINNQLNNPELIGRLNFPNTVKRFYKIVDSKASWLLPETNIGPTASAMLLLDCVRQYGLQHDNYHPEILTYTLMHEVLDSTALKSAAQKVEFEIMLTDAMISMINHLHFGAYNPSLNQRALDEGLPKRLNTATFLQEALKSKDLMAKILTVQPKIDQYKQLQQYMKLIAGQYICDSYETPESEIRKIVMNMERLRWNELTSDSYVKVNIPSFQLTYLTPDSTYLFKTVIGKPSTPTPTLISQIAYLETAPDWIVPNKIFINELLPKAIKDNAYFDNNHMAVYDAKESFVPITAASLAEIKKHPKLYHAKQTAGCDNALGKVVFRFNNTQDIYLHDTPEQQYFARKKRAISHGCIRVEHAEYLANLLLKNDNQANQVPLVEKAMSAYRKQKFALNQPVTILITYLTITVEDKLLVHHEDLYKLDKSLEAQMFEKPEQLTNISIKK